jgi:glucan phosphorylase
MCLAWFETLLPRHLEIIFVDALDVAIEDGVGIDRRLCALYADPEAWASKAILNVASSGKFSSDRTIAEYAADIWHATPCPVS